METQSKARKNRSAAIENQAAAVIYYRIQERAIRSPQRVTCSSASRRELGCALALHEDPFVAALLHRNALGRHAPDNLGDRGGVVEVAVREGLLDGLGGSLGAIVGDGAVDMVHLSSED